MDIPSQQQLRMFALENDKMKELSPQDIVITATERWELLILEVVKNLDGWEYYIAILARNEGELHKYYSGPVFVKLGKYYPVYRDNYYYSNEEAALINLIEVQKRIQNGRVSMYE